MKLKIFALAFFVLWFANCSSMSKLIKEPKVTLANLRLENPNSTGATLVFGVQVENPNSVALSVDEVIYDLEVAGKSLTSGKLSDGAKVAANETKIIDVPITVKYSDLFSSVMQLLKTSATPYHIKGSAKMGLFNLPFDKQGEFKIEKGRLR
jgi:LEA14-like dessication related protein